MRERILYVHIGTHKTGTTSFQHFLQVAQNFIDIWVPVNPAHNIAWSLNGDERTHDHLSNTHTLYDMLRSSTEDKAIISSEDFEYLVENPLALKYFHGMVEQAGWKPEYIVMWRDVPSYLSSLCREIEKYPWEWLTTEEGCLQGRVWGTTMSYYTNRDMFREKWAVGPLYELEYTGDTIKDIMEFIDVDISEVPDEYKNIRVHITKEK